MNLGYPDRIHLTAPMSYKRSWFLSLILGTLATFAVALPVWPAEQVYFRYGSLELSLSVQSLQNWVKTGEIDSELSGYLVLMNPQQREQLRNLLQTRYDENYFNLSYMSYTSIGERFLKNVGKIVRTKDQGNGFEDLRTAFVKASEDDEGLSFINVLEEYPNNMEIDIGLLLGLIQRANGLIANTDDFMERLSQVASETAKTQANLLLRKDLRQSGSLSTVKQMVETQTDQIEFDLYSPQQLSSPTPVIVITSGFGAERDFFEDLAHHLASYGFMVAIPEHPGSDNRRRQAFFAGQHKELFDETEYIRRPQEVTAILDDLERRNASEFQGQLNLAQVGIFSHSFGGATALSLGGADLDFGQLQQDCGDKMDLLNVSLYYQCHALRLTQPVPQLRDPRVKALFLLGPFSRTLFGPQEMRQLDIPVFWEATHIDLPAPLVLEQMPIFKELTTPDRYLAVSQGLPHAHITFEVMSGLVQENEVARLKTLSMTYQKALTVAFFKTHISNDEGFRSYLNSAYAQSISETPYPIHLIEAETSRQLF